jgi:hypothetical protein
MSEEENFNELKEVITGLAEHAAAERRKEQPYQDLFKASEQGLSGLLSEANHQMTHIALGLADVIQKKFGIKRMSDKLWKLIKAHPIQLLFKNMPGFDGLVIYPPHSFHGYERAFVLSNQAEFEQMQEDCSLFLEDDQGMFEAKDAAHRHSFNV